jgi:zinc protease
MNRKIAPPIKDAVDYNLALKPYELFHLDNGIPVYAVHAGAQPVFQLELVYKAGNSFETQQGIASATNFLLKNGTSKRNAFEINEAFDGLGGYCQRACYNETSTITLHGLTKHMGDLMPIVEEMLTDSVFSEDELKIYQQNATQRLKVNLQKCEFVAGRMIDAMLYGEAHPYGKYTRFEDLDQLNTADIKQFYQKFYLSGDCMIFVCGQLPSDLATRLNAIFGKMNVSKDAIIVPKHEQFRSKEQKVRIENDPQSVQGAIRLASPFPNRHHPDYAGVSVLNTLFGGYFGSRLMSNIREDKGYTYGIYSYIQNHLSDTAWMISTEAGKDVAEAAVEEVYKEMKRLNEEPIDADELLLVRNYMMGGILGELDGPFQIMGKWKNIILNGLDEKYFNQSIQTIKTISAEELKVLSQKYLSPDKFYELIVY